MVWKSAKLHSASIDLLLTDIVMPRMNGKQLAREFAKMRPKAATIFFVSWEPRNQVLAVIFTGSV